ncbi:MAG: hypothetical protein Q7U54_07950 [Bacteroidales bacterium]|nr:hypothetical protein [Bacteroidales bacterium]
MEKNDFKNWLLVKTGKTIPENPLFDACLSDAIELLKHSKFNGIPFEQHYPLDEQMKAVSDSFQGSVKALLLPLSESSNIVFRDVRLSDYQHNRDMLLFQLSQLDVVD